MADEVACHGQTGGDDRSPEEPLATVGAARQIGKAVDRRLVAVADRVLADDFPCGRGPVARRL